MSERAPKGFIPLSTAEKGVSDRVQVDIPLPPFVDRDRIGVNIRRIEGFMNWGGIKTLSISGNLDQEKVQTETTVIGIDPSGEALAGKIGKTTMPQDYKYNRELAGDYNKGLPYAMKDIKANLGINVNQIANRITGEGDSRSTTLWSPELDKVTRVGIAKIGVDHLIKKVDLRTLEDAALFDIGVPFLSFLHQPGRSDILAVIEQFKFNIDNWQLAGFSLVFANGILNVSEFIRGQLLSKVLNYDAGNWRLSFVYGPQIDRAAILKLKSKAQTLVKDLGDLPNPK